MSMPSRKEYLSQIYPRYRQARKPEKTLMLTEFCATTGYHRQHALRLLNGPLKIKPDDYRTLNYEMSLAFSQ